MENQTHHNTGESKFTPGIIIARIIGLILSPRKTLQKSIHEKGSWIPIIILTGLMIILKLVMLPGVLDDLNDPAFLESYKNQRNISDVQAAQEITALKQFSPFLTLIESPVIILASIAFVGFIISLVGRFSFQKRLRFIYIFRLVAWTSLIGGIQITLTILLKLINPDWEFPSNFGFLFPAELADSFFHRLIKSLDLFFIWEIGLIVIGSSTLFEVSVEKALHSIGTLFVVFLVLNAIFPAGI